MQFYCVDDPNARIMRYTKSGLISCDQTHHFSLQYLRFRGLRFLQYFLLVVEHGRIPRVRTLTAGEKLIDATRFGRPSHAVLQGLQNADS